MNNAFAYQTNIPAGAGAFGYARTGKSLSQMTARRAVRVSRGQWVLAT